MPLFNIGGVRLELFPLNVSSVDHDRDSGLVTHPVFGGPVALESVGMGDEKISLKGDIFPRAIGGRAELELLEGLQRESQPVLVTRGQTKLGWFRITMIKEAHSHLDAGGYGRKVSVTIEIERDVKPVGTAQGAGLVTRLFGYA